MRIKIGDKLVGDGEPCFFVAEAGINHNGDVDIAKKLVDAAKECGADAIKFQTFKAKKLLSKNIVVPEHIGTSEDLVEMVHKLELSEEAHREVKRYCDKKNIMFLSTPLDNMSVDLLDELEVSAFKIASCDLDNLPLLGYVAGKGKPIILSTGMGTIDEIREALDTIQGKGNDQVILLHCVSLYPPKVSLVNLRAMETMKEVFSNPIGYSDHTIGITIPLAAAALGACVIEKHFTLDKNMDGPDHAISADPEDMRRMVDGIREIEAAFGTGEKAPQAQELEMKKSFRRSIIAVSDIAEGMTITEDMITYKRPGTGLSPKFAEQIIGKCAKRNIEADDFVTLNDV